MYKTILVKSLVEEGERLVQRLEARRLHIGAALWYYFDDRWRLVIVSPMVEREGPLRMYNRVEEALTQMQPTELSLSDISVMRPNGYEFKELRSTVERSMPFAAAHGMSTPRDITFEEAYIYRWPDRRSRPHRA